MFPSSPVQGDIYVSASNERWEFTGNGWKKPTVNLKMITQNTTFLVGTDFPTLNAAVSALGNYFIMPNVTLTIQLPTGLSTLTAILQGYKGPGSVRLKGANMSGAIPNSTDFQVSGNDDTARGNDRSYNHNLCVARYGSQIYAPDITGIQCNLTGTFDIIQDVYIYGNASAQPDPASGTGIMVTQGMACQLDNVTIGNFVTGLLIHSNGRVSAQNSQLNVFGCKDIGVNCLYGSLACNGLVSIGNKNLGVQGQNNNYLGIPSSLIAGNGSHGLVVQDAGYANVSGGIFNKGHGKGNGGYSIWAKSSSAIEATGADATKQSGTTSFYASVNSFIDASSAVGSPSFSPSVNATGNSNSYIKNN